jgi:two-component system, chemotaxis family, chemotaxis protein CheY
MPIVFFIDDSETSLVSTKITTQHLMIETKQYLFAKEALVDIKKGILPDLIITDMNMPEMDGMEFLEEIRNIESVKKTPVLMLTTEQKVELKERGKKLGLTGWIVKPFNPTQLQAAISRVLRLG